MSPFGNKRICEVPNRPKILMMAANERRATKLTLNYVSRKHNSNKILEHSKLRFTTD